MPVLFLNYRNGELTEAEGVLVDTYTDSWDVTWAEIAYNGSFVNIEAIGIVRMLPKAA
jgi:hypothetical protein